MKVKSILLNVNFIRKFSVYLSQLFHHHKRKRHLSKTPPRFTPKIFCIGYQKTGTTSLGRSLKMLGYSHSSFDYEMYMRFYKQEPNFEKILDYTSRFEAFDDLPWLKEDMIPLLDKTFPNSKFIYLTRDEKSWKKSMHKWGFKTRGVYPDLEMEWNGYLKHRDFVMEYFKDRLGKDVIILDIKDKMGFRKLADFLGREAPSNNFPHFNKTELVFTTFNKTKRKKILYRNFGT